MSTLDLPSVPAAQLLQAAGEAVLAADPAGRLYYANAAARRLFDLPDDPAGQPLPAVLDLSRMDLLRAGRRGRPDQPLRFATQVVDGPVARTLQVTVSPTADGHGRATGTVVVAVDVTEVAGLRLQSRHAGLHDHVTGLGNRAQLLARIHEALHRAASAGEEVAVVSVDAGAAVAPDGTGSPEVVEEVLRSVARLLSAVAEPRDAVARTGGEVFAVCCRAADAGVRAQGMADRILRVLPADPPAGGARPVSIGIAVAPHDGGDAETLLRHADLARQAAAERGGGRSQRYTEGLGARARRRTALRSGMLEVLGSQLDVHYQPVVRLSTGTLAGMEALARWTHPELGAVAPEEFIPLAEETSLILPLGRLVLQRACRQLARWQRLAPDLPLVMSVNLSARQLVDDELVDFLGGLLLEGDIDPAALCLEFTETAVGTDLDHAAQQAHQLKALGVQLAVDDYGSGYASLAHLRRLPLDRLKVPRELIASLGTSPEDAAIVTSVVRLADTLGLEVVVEGIETAAQRDHMAALGCDLAQGHLWSPAQPVSAIETLLRDRPAWQPAHPPPDDVVDGGELLDPEEVAAVLRHELANPLTVIQGWTELLRRQPDTDPDGPLSAAVEAIGRSTEAIDVLLRALDDLRLIGAGTIPLQRRPTDLADLARRGVTDLATALEDHPTEVTVRSRRTWAHVDPHRTAQIVTNLLLNAARHTPPGTPVTVSVAVDDRCARVVVADQGPGVPAHRVDELFRKFVRLDRRRPGTGLGLFLCRGLARAHGGDLRYEPADGGGAAFVLEVPAG